MLKRISEAELLGMRAYNYWLNKQTAYKHRLLDAIRAAYAEIDAQSGRIAELESELAQLKDILTIEREDWKDMNKRWQKAEAKVTACNKYSSEVYNLIIEHSKAREKIKLQDILLETNADAKIKAERDKAESEYLEQAKRTDEQMERIAELEAELAKALQDKPKGESK